MSFDVIDQYNSFVENNFIKTNNLQIEVLQKLKQTWSDYKKNKFFS